MSFRKVEIMNESNSYLSSADEEASFEIYLPMAERILLTSGSISLSDIIKRFEITKNVANRIMDCVKDRFLNTRAYNE